MNGTLILLQRVRELEGQLKGEPVALKEDGEHKDHSTSVTSATSMVNNAIQTHMHTPFPLFCVSAINCQLLCESKLIFFIFIMNYFLLSLDWWGARLWRSTGWKGERYQKSFHQSLFTPLHATHIGNKSSGSLSKWGIVLYYINLYSLGLFWKPFYLSFYHNISKQNHFHYSCIEICHCSASP